jgi:hypothetical protein
MKSIKTLSLSQFEEFSEVLKVRFEKNKQRHKDLIWEDVQAKLQAQYSETQASSNKLWSLFEMERTGGEPDVVGFDEKTKEFIFYDCSAESPKGRRSFCYDLDGWESRKDFKPENNAVDMAAEMGIEILSEEEYKALQQLGTFDTKTSSWIKTPSEIRKLGGALFGDFRYGRVFIYHNGAASYFAARAFRGSLRL